MSLVWSFSLFEKASDRRVGKAPKAPAHAFFATRPRHRRGPRDASVAGCPFGLHARQRALRVGTAALPPLPTLRNYQLRTSATIAAAARPSHAAMRMMPPDGAAIGN